MKFALGCLMFASLVLTVVRGEDTEFVDGMKKIHAAKGEEQFKLATTFVEKYGKARICKYFTPEWKKAEKLKHHDEILKKSCDNEKDGDKEFLEIVKGLFKEDKHTI